MREALRRRDLFCKDENTRLLVVEGKDDCHGIYQIACKYGLENAFGLWSGDSDDGALRRFSGLLLSTDQRPKVLGIVLDCDADEDSGATAISRRWHQVRSRLVTLGYVLPLEPQLNGTILEGTPDLPRIGIWLMPDNQNDGMFEDFLLELVPEVTLTFARRVVNLASLKQLTSFKPAHLSKSVAHTFLAWQDEPGRPIGIAIKSGIFNVASPPAIAFVKWLETLFIEPAQ